jgi:hypothetical protein
MRMPIVAMHLYLHSKRVEKKLSATMQNEMVKKQCFSLSSTV